MHASAIPSCHIRTLLSIFEVACVDKDVLLEALDAGFTDFKDAVLHGAAPVFDPSEFLAALQASD